MKILGESFKIFTTWFHYKESTRVDNDMDITILYDRTHSVVGALTDLKRKEEILRNEVGTTF
jgi:hypothetical protein